LERAAERGAKLRERRPRPDRPIRARGDVPPRDR